jgi:hypothetical protein
MRSYSRPPARVDPVAATLCARIRAHIDAAVAALPAALQDSHGEAVAMLFHLLLRHTPPGHVPARFIAGPRAFATPAVLWAAALLTIPIMPCGAPACAEPDHVSLVTRPLGGEEERDA